MEGPDDEAKVDHTQEENDCEGDPGAESGARRQNEVD
jgi:hypothetical protein